MEDNPTLACVSWNIHRGRGQDGIVDADRTLDVLLGDVCADLPDILCLQEADEEARPHRGLLDLERFERETGLFHAHRDPGSRWSGDSHGFLGVVLFHGPGVHLQDLVLLDLPGQCHRGAVVADILCRGQPSRLVGTHLSLSQILRVAQMRTIGQHLARRAPRQTILCGDLNEWRPWGGLALSPKVLGFRLHGPAPSTFPSGRPILPLDRILTSAPGRVERPRVLDSAGIRAASDHRPLSAQVRIGAGR
jgi:endonuclease/exonuclease/phosphatase family metal-dependent hydrolase